MAGEPQQPREREVYSLRGSLGYPIECALFLSATRVPQMYLGLNYD